MNKEERFRRFALGLIASDSEFDVLQLYARFAQQYAFFPEMIETDDRDHHHDQSFIRFAAEAVVQVERGPRGWQRVRPVGAA